MPEHNTVLIIENNYAQRANILNEFRKHRLNNRITFVNNEKEALVEIYFFNKEKTYEGFPQVILLDFSKKRLTIPATVKN